MDKILEQKCSRMIEDVIVTHDDGAVKLIDIVREPIQLIYGMQTERSLSAIVVSLVDEIAAALQYLTTEYIDAADLEVSKMSSVELMATAYSFIAQQMMDDLSE